MTAKVEKEKNEDRKVLIFVSLLFVGLISCFFIAKEITSEWSAPDSKRDEVHQSLMGYWEEKGFDKYSRDTITFLKKGIRVNGRLVSSDYRLNFTGDEIEFTFGLDKFYCQVSGATLKCKDPRKRYEPQFTKIRPL